MSAKKPLNKLPARLMAALTMATFVGCNRNSGGGGPPPENAMPVVIERPVLMTVEDVVTAVGTIEANERVEIQPEVAGLIQQVLFEEGDSATKGQTLFVMDSRTEAAAVAEAEAEKQLAEANLKRARLLTDSKAISQQELDQLESVRAVKSAVLNVAQENLAKRSIIAPFNGELGARFVSPGQYVTAGTPLVTLVDKDRVKVRFRIPERQLSLLHHGQPGRLSVAAWPDETFAGAVDLIDPVVDASTRTVEIRLLVNNPDRQLRPGMFARVSVVVDTRPDAIVIPEAALIPSMDKFSVYAVRDGIARLQAVELGVRLPGRTEIVEGLEPESEFVTGGIQKIVDGMKVTALPVATNASVVVD